MNDDQRRQSGTALIVTGAVLGAIPFLSLFILIVSTGHAVQPGGETAFFGLVYLGFASGICTVPLGLTMVIAGIRRLATTSKPPE